MLTNPYPAVRDHAFIVAESVEQDQHAHTCSLILLYTIHCFISNVLQLTKPNQLLLKRLKSE